MTTRWLHWSGQKLTQFENFPVFYSSRLSVWFRNIFQVKLRTWWKILITDSNGFHMHRLKVANQYRAGNKNSNCYGLEITHNNLYRWGSLLPVSKFHVRGRDFTEPADPSALQSGHNVRTKRRISRLQGQEDFSSSTSSLRDWHPHTNSTHCGIVDSQYTDSWLLPHPDPGALVMVTFDHRSLYH